MLGLRGAYHAVRTANGPAQHLACAVVGLTDAQIDDLFRSAMQIEA